MGPRAPRWYATRFLSLALPPASLPASPAASPAARSPSASALSPSQVREKERQIFALQTELLRSSRAAEGAAAEASTATAALEAQATALDEAVTEAEAREAKMKAKHSASVKALAAEYEDDASRDGAPHARGPTALIPLFPLQVRGSCR